MLETTLPLLDLLVPYFQRSETDINCPEVTIHDIIWYQVHFTKR